MTKSFPFTVHPSPLTLRYPFTIYPSFTKVTEGRRLPLIDHWSLIIINSLPGLRSQGHFGGVGKIDNCRLKIESISGDGGV